MCSDNDETEIACNLTSLELQKRKATVIAELRKKILAVEETTMGFRYKFDAADSTLDQLTDFIKTERQCCGFFTFNLSVSNERGYIWLEITGQESVKEFIKAELEM